MKWLVFVYRLEGCNYGKIEHFHFHCRKVHLELIRVINPFLFTIYKKRREKCRINTSYTSYDDQTMVEIKICNKFIIMFVPCVGSNVCITSVYKKLAIFRYHPFYESRIPTTIFCNTYIEQFLVCLRFDRLFVSNLKLSLHFFC